MKLIGSNSAEQILLFKICSKFEAGSVRNYGTMPLTIDIDRERNLTVIKLVGIVAFDELQESMLEYYKDGHTDLIMVDLTEAKGQGKTYSHDRLYQFASVVENFRKNCQTAKTALVASEDLYFGLCRILEAYRNTSNIKYSTFRTMDEAVEWIEDTEK